MSFRLFEDSAFVQNVAECEQGIKELQENQQVLSQRLADQKQQLMEVCSSSSSLDQEYRTLQDTKDQVSS